MVAHKQEEIELRSKTEKERKQGKRKQAKEEEKRGKGRPWASLGQRAKAGDQEPKQRKKHAMWRRNVLIVIAMHTFRVFADTFDNLLVLRIDSHGHHSQAVDKALLVPQLDQ